MDKVISQVTISCHTCATIKTLQKMVQPQSTGEPTDSVGRFFAADVMIRSRQKVLVLRETVTSFTTACFVENEQHITLNDALIRLCVELRPLDGPFAVVRVDGAPVFVALSKDTTLQKNRISIEIGRTKNINKNPVAECAIQELEHELIRFEPHGGPVSSLTLSLAVASLNSRIRNRGLSAREMWTQRDQYSHTQLPIKDQTLILEQHSDRLSNHPYSMRSKNPKGRFYLICSVEVGDVVYLNCDRNKTCARDCYLVISTDKEWCDIKKFTGSQLRPTSYRVKQSECFKVPQDSLTRESQPNHSMALGTDIDHLPTEPAHPPDLMPEASHILPETLTDQDPNVTLMSAPVSDGHESVYHDQTINVPHGDTSMPRRSSRGRKPPAYLQDYIVSYT